MDKYRRLPRDSRRREAVRIRAMMVVGDFNVCMTASFPARA